MFPKKFAAIILLAVLLLSNTLAIAEESDTAWVQFTFENDAFGLIDTSDNGYTNGIEWSWGHKVAHDYERLALPNWLDAFYGWSYLNQGSDRHYQLSYNLSQRMYTPDDIEIEELIPSDRPYAGTLLWEVDLKSYAAGISDNLSLTLGVVGPASFAEQTQKGIHNIIEAKQPQGWEHQLDNELVFQLEATRLYQWTYQQINDSLEFDSVVIAQAAAGNLMSNVGAGVSFRLGNILKDSYAYIQPAASRGHGGYQLKSKTDLSWQFFATIYTRYVFNDITLDGNTFKDSHSVNLTHEQAMINMGFTLNWQDWGLTFSAIRGSEQYEDQKSKPNFAGVSISYQY
ncbi:lipid A deacylase LpxR family protein [Shewanella donghaensis]|uniref:lipid A deacylase LpxR family protein n=1 Tax=Shewanella donghaensis TaxID=238836 RepID=UPI0011826606|nr:lipid A deacylase LpxR family protein [Shewanella donghaensis]